jgi:hypothetical protein
MKKRYRWYRNRKFSPAHSIIAAAWWQTNWRGLLKRHIQLLRKEFDSGGIIDL